MKFPYGISDFRQVIAEGYYFVDRSDQAGLRAAGVGGGLDDFSHLKKDDHPGWIRHSVASAPAGPTGIG